MRIVTVCVAFTILTALEWSVSANNGLTLLPSYATEKNVPFSFTTNDSPALQDIRDRSNEAIDVAGKGRRREAVRMLQQLVQLARGMQESHKRDEALGKVALTQAEIGDFTNALHTTHFIFDGTIRTEALALINVRETNASSDPVKLAFLRAEVGDIRGAGEALSRLDDALARSYVLEGIVKQQLRAQDIDGAQQLAELITDIAIHTTTLQLIAWGQVKENDIGGALKTLQGMDDASRDAVLVALVESRARKKDLTGARQLAEAIVDSSKHLFAERYIEAYSEAP